MTSRQSSRYWEVITRSLDTYGLLNQIGQTEEEMAELIVALSKWQRGTGHGQAVRGDLTLDEIRGQVIEELADTQIMLDQMIKGFNAELEVNEMLHMKIERQARILGGRDAENL